MKLSIVKLCKFIVLVLVIFSSLFSATTGYAFFSGQSLILENNKALPQFSAISLSDEETGKCYSLDVIFVIDQSSTMSDSGYPTDPTSQRQTAVQAMVDWLASNVLDVCKKARHQIGVISFGVKAHIDLPLTEIAPVTIEELRALEKRVNQDIRAYDLGSDTQPMEAFREIPKMFEDSKISGTGVRKRVVIFLTDGLIGCDSFSCKPQDGFVKPTQKLADYIDKALPFDANLLKREQCVSEQVSAYGTIDDVSPENLKKCYTDHLVNDVAYENSTYLYTVLMGFGQAWPVETKRVYRVMAESHAGEVVDFYDKGAENRQEIPSYFVTVLSKLSGISSGQIECGGVAVNPYLDKAVFTFYKFSSDTKVNLYYTDEQGVEHKIVGNESNSGGFNVSDYQEYGTNERYIFDKPYPGIWHVDSDRCNSGGITAFYQPFKINPGGFTPPIPSLLHKYDIPPYYDASNPIYLTYQMKDDAGEVIDNSDRSIFSVNVKATVIDPSSNPKEYLLKWNSDEKNFKSTEPLQIPLAGTYQISYVGTTKMRDDDLSIAKGDEIMDDVFNTVKDIFKNNNQFNVEDVIPFAFTIKPANEQVLPQIHGTILSGWPLPVVPIPVRVEVHGRIPEEDDEEPEDMPTEQIILNPEKAFTAWIVSADKNQQSKPISLEPDPNNPDVFIGEIPWDDSQEQITLHVELMGEFAKGYGPDFRKADSVFSRRDASPFYREGFYYFLLGLFILFIILLIIRYIWMHTNPVTGTLIIFKDNVEAERLNVATGRRISTFKYKGRGVDFVVISVRKLPKPKNSEEGEDVPDAVVVYGKTECKQQFKVILNPGDKASYCNTHFDYEIQYER